MHFRSCLDRLIDKPNLRAAFYEILRSHLHEIRVSEPGIAAKQEGIQGPFLLPRTSALPQFLQSFQFLRRQMGMRVLYRLNLILAEGIFAFLHKILVDGHVDVSLQMLHVLGDGIDVVALPAEMLFEGTDKIKSHFGKLHFRLESLQQCEGRQMILRELSFRFACETSRS